MEIVAFDRVSAYNRSLKRFYRNDGVFKNNKSAILQIVCNPNGVFFRHSIQKMIGVLDGGKILCQCVLIKHRAYDALMVSFFEAEKGAVTAVGLMMKYAQKTGKELGCKRLTVSLDGHCNYSVGFLYDESKTPPLFGESYTPQYYHDFFQHSYSRVIFKSFCESFENIENRINHLSSGTKLKFADIVLSCADFKAFGYTMKRYTDLCNLIFTNHRYCFERAYDEDMELFAPMKPLLKPCNLIFASKNGIDIGFILMYPNFNELVSAGSEVNAISFIKHKLLTIPIRTMKIAEIGVLPEYRASGVILLLFSEALRQIKSHYRKIDRVASSWILEENTQSINITTRFLKQIHKRFVAYEKEI